MSTNKYCCEFCGKLFMRKTDHKKHAYICEIINSSKRQEIILDEEITNIPSTFQLYKIILEMGKKINILEEKLNGIHKISNTEKVDILSTLNSTISSHLYLNTPLFIDWIKTVIVTDIDLELFIEKDFITAFTNIIVTSVKVFETIHQIPIKWVDQKKNTFYIWSIDTVDTRDNRDNRDNRDDRDILNNNKYWKKMNKDDFIYIIKIIHKKLFQHLCNWKKTNIAKFTQNHKMEEIHGKNIIKMMNVIEIDQEILSGKIKSNLFSNLVSNFIKS